jgi:hypothetical protein
MRLHEIITESQMDEGPIGRGIGKLVGGAARGIGAIAGGVVGAGTALKKGYQSGKAVVGDDPDPNAGKPGYTPPAEAPVAAPAPAAVADPKAAPAPAPTAVADPNAAPAPAPVADPNAAPAPTTPPTAKDINAAGPEGSAPAKDQTGDALAKTDAVTDKQTSTKAGETVYAQVKANIDKLDAKGKGRILQLVKQSLAAPAPGADPRDLNKDGKVDATEKSIAKNKAKPGAAPPPAAAADPGAAAFGNMAKTLTQEPTTGAASTAAAPAGEAPATTATPTPDPAAKSQTLTPQQQASQAALKAKLQGTKAAGKSVAASTTGGFGKAVAAAKAKGIATASKINYGNALSEALAQRVEMHKQKMFETELSKGTISVFRK